MSNRFFPNAGHMYANSFVPRLVTCQFTVDATQGAGISGLISNGFIRSVYMHSSSPSASNPNPVSGVIQVQMSDNYTKLLQVFSSIQSPTTGSDLSVRSADTALSVGSMYQITVLGSATAANWVTLGVPSNITPAVGVSFIAAATGAGTSTSSKVKAIGSSGVNKIEIVGNSNLALPNAPQQPGEYIMLQCLGDSSASPVLTMNSYTPAGTITNGTPDTFAGTPAVLTGSISAPAISQALVAPAAGSIISLSFLFNDSSATVDGL